MSLLIDSLMWNHLVDDAQIRRGGTRQVTVYLVRLTEAPHISVVDDHFISKLNR